MRMERGFPTVNVEFFGLARLRAGVDRTTAIGANLGDVLLDLSGRFPSLASTCIDGQRLKSGFIANLSGDRFVSEPATPLRDGDALLLLSLDAGG